MEANAAKTYRLVSRGPASTIHITPSGRWLPSMPPKLSDASML